MALMNGNVSFWWTQVGRPAPRPALEGDLDCDVCIVGGGLTGLWTAYWLSHHDPALDIIVLEAEFAGFGASGRNGGWLSAQLSGYTEPALVAAMEQAVDEVIGVCADEGIAADVVKSGVLLVARSPAQLVRMRERFSGAELNADEVAARVRVDGALGARFNPHAARVHPARLVAGIAAAVESRGVRILERTRVTRIDRGAATTDAGVVRAPVVLRCLEGYTASIRGQRRTWLPMNSAMIVTEPLGDRVWDEIGWSGSELLGDCANAYCYAQRTADGRIALGGRGIPYRFGSRTDTDGRTQDWTIESLLRTLHALFPSTRDVRIAHAWCGVLGVPRDWCASVTYGQGLGSAGGYVGSGLTTTYLAGRTLADLVLERDSELVTFPWVGRRVRRWEPEPLRWLGVRAMYGLYRAADRREDAGLLRPSRLARVGDRLTGR
ncbi:NAD(P)/FAD-dependent oxidoreductase [Aeromicrobium sp.]|uniref:NAD(P)/FAD-dependent oxidoreductase n=1 Tax=Aeromicrobium sp. TaxID=1871063 RepID=UPI003D6AE561